MNKLLKLAFFLAIVPMVVACKAQTVDLSFMVYNYSTYGLADISVNGKGHTNSGAAERLGSLGGSGTACCASLLANSDTAEVSFYTDRGEGYKQYNIKVPVENLKDQPRSFAVLHYFPNNTGVIEVTMRWPTPRKDLFDKAMGDKAKNIVLDSPEMWNSISTNEQARIDFPDE